MRPEGLGVLSSAVLTHMVLRLTAQSSAALLLSAGALLGGCGGGSSTMSGPAAATSATSESSAASSKPSESSTAPGSGTSTVPSRGVQQEIAAGCKAVLHLATLSATEKVKVATICKKAEDGDIAAAHAAAKELCMEVINSSPLASGAAKEKALAACKTG